MQINNAGQPTSRPHLEYIDCLRGYAVILVATTHLTSAMPHLPYPVARFTILGWYGVQLFFLMSAVTLAISWNKELKRNGAVSLLSFFVRRYLRIAPAYYLAAALYYFIHPPGSSFDWGHLIGTLTFTNGWSPKYMPTLHDQWTVVPGGWSISTEFSFYLIFPILVTIITSIRRAIVAFLAAILIAALANECVHSALAQSYPSYALSQFFYFWFPNQLPAFVAGLCLYFVIADESPLAAKVVRLIKPRRYLLLGFAITAFLAVSFIPLSHYLTLRFQVSETLYVLVPFICLAASFASGPNPFVNRAAAEMGKVSFSGYLLQFAIIDLMRTWGFLGFGAVGASAIGHFFVNFLVLVVVLYICALAQYRAVELPMNNFARVLSRSMMKKRQHKIAQG